VISDGLQARIGTPAQLRPFYACAHLPIDSIVLEGLRKQSFDRLRRRCGVHALAAAL
jgi:hypothetical protein